jgi:tRNA dimethylallyltransferase
MVSGDAAGRGPGRRAVLIAGPTASGKSRLALEMAQAEGGVIINADAMQVYEVLDVLSARPRQPYGVPHALYGAVHPSVRYSTGAWLAVAQALMDAPEHAGKPLIFVGGTGLYFDALTNGFAQVPPVPAEIVAAVEAELAGLDAEGRGRLIAARDPEMAARLKAPDPQRVARALAVLAATGQSLARFQDEAADAPLRGFAVERLVVNPDPQVLRQRIAGRFEEMLDLGAVAEVEALRALGLDPSLPAMKAIGVREISDWLDGRIDRETMIERAVIATRQYAKRQRTWLRGRMADWRWTDGAQRGS